MEAAAGQRVEPVRRSGELLDVGSSVGLYNKLLVNSKQNKKTSSCPPIVKMPRSSILDRVQNFLPQMAQANEDLHREIQSSSDGKFDIENVEGEENVIEMNVALVALDSSDSSEEDTDGSDDSSDSDGEVTEHNIRLRQKGKKGKIEELDPNK